MPEGRFDKAQGRSAGRYAFVSATVSLSNDDTYDTGLGTITQSFAESKADAGHFASVSDTSDGTVTLELKDDAAAAVTADEEIDIFVVGEA